MYVLIDELLEWMAGSGINRELGRGHVRVTRGLHVETCMAVTRTTFRLFQRCVDRGSPMDPSNGCFSAVRGVLAAMAAYLACFTRKFTLAHHLINFKKERPRRAWVLTLQING